MRGASAPPLLPRRDHREWDTGTTAEPGELLLHTRIRIRFAHPSQYRSTPSGSENRELPASGFAGAHPEVKHPSTPPESWRRGLHGGRMHPYYLRWLHCPGTTAVGLLGVPRRFLLRAGEPSCPSCSSCSSCTSCSSCFRLRCADFVQAALPPRKSPYLTPWSERSWRLLKGASPLRVAQFS